MCGVGLIPAKITAFSGEVKKLEFVNAQAVDFFTKKLPSVLPENVSVYFECDLLDLRGTIRSAIKSEGE
mgnify:CR=1 FL=1|jgi:hypothetical protein